jgi:NADH dehydrogenase
MQTIVVIGGGFAGMNFIKNLDENKYRVKLVDKNNFTAFPPLFYQVASSGLTSSNIAFPFRREFKHRRNFSFHMGEVKAIDVNAKTVTTVYETIPYDKLVIATGTVNNYFNMPILEERVFGIKSVAQAVRTRDMILACLERGSICDDPKRRRELLSFIVVGGGPSGVEIAGALGEMKKYVVPREYPELDASEVNITLVEGSDRLLGAMDKRCGEKAHEYLTNLMVDVRLNTVLKDYTDKKACFTDGSVLHCETMIWTAGVKGERLQGIPETAIECSGRISVDEYNRVVGLNDVYALGDIAAMKSTDYPHGHPQVAQPAIQQGVNLARNLNCEELRYPFAYNDKGSMATVGKNRAIVMLKNRFISGYIAWLMWMFIHLISILGMKNKIIVLVNWMWNYLTYATSLRLLIRPAKYPLRKHWGD